MTYQEFQSYAARKNNYAVRRMVIPFLTKAYQELGQLAERPAAVARAWAIYKEWRKENPNASTESFTKANNYFRS